jgi:hypothetical protein
MYDQFFPLPQSKKSKRLFEFWRSRFNYYASRFRRDGIQAIATGKDKAREEWDTRKFDRDGSEMGLYFKRG